jgi:uncharacterized protein (TIGR02444 family)
MDNPFWDYACAVYANESVARCCLQLQDDYGVDVNLLLYGAWLGQQDLALTGAHLRLAEAQVAPWRDEVVRPLRRLRRALGEPGRRGTAYTDVKALELVAERQQQDILYACFGRDVPPVCDGCLLDNLCAVVQVFDGNRASWNDQVVHLSQLLCGAAAGVAPAQGR